jgi:carboxyl-terminal processing protease
MPKTFTFYTAFVLLLFTSMSSFGQGKAQAFEISKNLDIYATLFKELNNNYVDEINPGELNTAALDAMLETLDPYTVYIPESKIEEVKFLTTGEYGGIGLSVIKRDDKVIISMIQSESPALESGLLAGDEIISVDEQVLADRTDEEISMLLKGQPGTAIDMKIRRSNDSDIFHKDVTRRKINIDAVPYYGMLDSSIAYLNLTSFTKKSAQKVAAAFSDLKKENLQGLIFDLRGNGGGLMGEAVDIMNLFVNKDIEIVRTKSRLREKNYIYKTRKNPVDTIIPIVFLVDRNTASASEIVSGSAQDLDRAVIIGERTYGKGLVQNVVPLSFNSQFKVTIAKYYIPSGRCVQAIDYSHKDDEGNPIAVNDSLLEEFKTKNGRSVFDGRGIKPDILMAPVELSDIEKTLIEKYYIFDFSTQYRLSHDSIAPPDEFTISDEIWNSFLDFIKNKDITYESEVEKKFNSFKEQAEKDEMLNEFQDVCVQIQKQIDEQKKLEFEENQDRIKRILRTDLVSRYYFTRGVIITNLHQDKAIAKAIELLHDTEKYHQILN